RGSAVDCHSGQLRHEEAIPRGQPGESMARLQITPGVVQPSLSRSQHRPGSERLADLVEGKQVRQLRLKQRRASVDCPRGPARRVEAQTPTPLRDLRERDLIHIEPGGDLWIGGFVPRRSEDRIKAAIELSPGLVARYPYGKRPEVSPFVGQRKNAEPRVEALA